MRIITLVVMELTMIYCIQCLSPLHWRHLSRQVHICHVDIGDDKLVNIQQTMNRIKSCFTIGSRHCRMLTKTEDMIWKRDIILHRTYFCGFLHYHHTHGVSKPIRIIWIIDYSPHYHVDMSILEFSINWSQKRCSQHALIIKDGDLYQAHCGRKLPWNFLTNNKNVIFMLFNQKKYTGVFNVLAYYKISESSPKVSEKRLIIFDINKWMPIEIIRSPYKLFVSVHPLYHIVTLIFFPHNIQNIYLYDGPGKKSPLLTPTNMTNGLGHQFISTAFHNLLEIYQFSRNTMLYLRYAGILTTKGGNLPEVLSRKVFNVQTNRKGQQNLAWIRWFVAGKGDQDDFQPYLSLKRFTFVGPSGIASNLDFDCQYGGLFFVPIQFLKLSPGEMLSFCENSTIYDTPYLFKNNYDGFAVYIITFHNYSFIDTSFIYVIVNRCHYQYLNCFDNSFKNQDTYSACTTSLVTHGEQCKFTLYNHQRMSFIPTNITLSNIYGDIHRGPSWGSVANVSDCMLDIQVQWSTEFMSADYEITNIKVRTKAATFFSYRNLNYIKVKSSQCEITRYVIYMVQYMCPGYGRIVGNSSIIFPGCWTYYDAKQEPIRLFFFPDYNKAHMKVGYFVCDTQCFTAIITLKYSIFKGDYIESTYTERTWVLRKEALVYLNDIPYPAVLQIDVQPLSKCSPSYCLIKIEMKRDTRRRNELNVSSEYVPEDDAQFVFLRARYVR